MKTRALLLALPLAALAACRDNRASVQIQEICSATDDCTFGDKCDFSTPEPIFDPSVADRLTLPLQVENQLVDNTNLGLGKTNTNDAHVDEVAVEYTGAFSGRVVLEANGWIPAGSTKLIIADIIPTVPAAAIAAPGTGVRKQIVASVRLRGYYDDGSRFETDEFPIAITVCGNCTPVCASGLYCLGAGQWPTACMDPAGAGTTP